MRDMKKTAPQRRAATKKLLLGIGDMLLVLVALGIAMLLHFDGRIPQSQLELWPVYVLTNLFAYLAMLLSMRMYNIMWQLAGSKELLKMVCFMGAGGLLTLAMNVIFAAGLSNSVLILTCMCAIALIGCMRLILRVAYKLRWQRRDRGEGEKSARENREAHPVLIVGAGEAGRYCISMFREGNLLKGMPVACVDDDPAKWGMRLQGVPVRGKLEEIPQIVARYHIREIIIAIPSLDKTRMQQIVTLCSDTRCRVRILYLAQDLDARSQRATPRLRNIDIADFLARKEVDIDVEPISDYLRDQTILVTGGGGSIGSELCRQIMRFAPKLLLIFDIYENHAYELECELRQKYGEDCRTIVLVGSVRDRKRLDEVMTRYRPQVVFHAAAHKHVPLMEISPAEAVKNNVAGTQNLIESADAHGVKRFVLLSSDKAVKPANVMGATKRICEMIVQTYALRTQMKCMVVRFGNVLGSRGSVIPLFEEQIAAGGPVTITDPEITRYFMTIPEAAQLVLQAGGIAENGAIFVLDMGEPVKILDLAHMLIRYHGLEPEKDIPIKIIGLRPGEKMHEELMNPFEKAQMHRTEKETIMVAPPYEINTIVFKTRLDRLIQIAVQEPDKVEPLIFDLTGTVKERQYIGGEHGSGIVAAN